MTKKIIFASGGTGGHIFPAVNLMKHFSERGYIHFRRKLQSYFMRIIVIS